MQQLEKLLHGAPKGGMHHAKPTLADSWLDVSLLNSPAEQGHKGKEF